MFPTQNVPLYGHKGCPDIRVDRIDAEWTVPGGGNHQPSGRTGYAGNRLGFHCAPAG